MNNLMSRNNEEFGAVRTIEIDGEPWFVGRDIATALGYAKPENAIVNHVDNEDKITTLIQGNGSDYKSKTTIINESDMYSLVLRSKLESVKRFKRWITTTVLPSIRKAGGYMTEDVATKIAGSDWGITMTLMLTPKGYVELLKRYKRRETVN